jgi:alpha-beta hydrolase superfamily lysophospholipase
MAKVRQLPVAWKTGSQSIRGMLHVARPRGGTWCILCHGFTGHRIGPGYMFVRISRELEQRGISSLRFDFRGAGESDGLFKNMTVSTMLSDLASAIKFVRRTYAPKRLILLGHSLGGMIAALSCAKAKADGLALFAPVGDPMGLIRRRKDILKTGPNASGYYENGPHEMSLSFIDGLKNIAPPAAMAANFHGRLLLIQGDADASIAVLESARYVKAAGSAGIATAYYILQGADHNFSTVATMNKACRMLTEWTKECAR